MLSGEQDVERNQKSITPHPVYEARTALETRSSGTGTGKFTRRPSMFPPRCHLPNCTSMDAGAQRMQDWTYSTSSLASVTYV